MPKSVDHEQRRREITSATWRAIDELGVEGTTMRAIADRAGCTTGRLSHYFANRDDILLAALRHAHLQAAQRMVTVLEGNTGRTALRAVLLEALPLDDERRREWKVWITFWSEAIATEALRQEHHMRYREWRTLVASLVTAVAPDRSRSEHTRITDMLVALVDGLGVHALMAPERKADQQTRRTIDTALDHLLTPG